MDKDIDQQRIWQVLRRLRTASLTDIRAIAGIAGNGDLLNEDTTRDYLNRLANHGYIEKLKGDWFRLLNNTGYYAPMIVKIQGRKTICDSNTEQIVNPVRAPLTNNKGRILRAIKLQQEFTIDDLLHNTDLGYESIKTVLKSTG